MIKSMTGFASLTQDDEAATITVTVRSVNHRFLDLQLRLPSSLTALESRLRARVQQRVARGRVDPARTSGGSCQSPSPPRERLGAGCRSGAHGAASWFICMIGSRIDSAMKTTMPAMINTMNGSRRLVSLRMDVSTSLS